MTLDVNGTPSIATLGRIVPRQCCADVEKQLSVLKRYGPVLRVDGHWPCYVSDREAIDRMEWPGANAVADDCHGSVGGRRDCHGPRNVERHALAVGGELGRKRAGHDHLAAAESLCRLAVHRVVN